MNKNIQNLIENYKVHISEIVDSCVDNSFVIGSNFYDLSLRTHGRSKDYILYTVLAYIKLFDAIKSFKNDIDASIYLYHLTYHNVDLLSRIYTHSKDYVIHRFGEAYVNYSDDKIANLAINSTFYALRYILCSTVARPCIASINEYEKELLFECGCRVEQFYTDNGN